MPKFVIFTYITANMAVISNITDNYMLLIVEIKGFPAFQGSEFQKNFRGCMPPDPLEILHLRRSMSPTNIKTAPRSLY